MVAYSFKRRFVEPIRRGLVSAYSDEAGIAPKRQTIRADRRRHARPGEELQLYCGMRTKGCFLIGRARCVSAEPIKIEFNPVYPLVLVNYRIYRRSIQHFARADGFRSWADLRTFWEQEHPGVETFEGVIIKWEPLS